MQTTCSSRNVGWLSRDCKDIIFQNIVLFITTVVRNSNPTCLLKLKSMVENRNRDSSVGIATGYEPDYRRMRNRVPVEAKIFCYPRYPDRFLGPPTLLLNGCHEIFSRGVRYILVKILSRVGGLRDKNIRGFSGFNEGVYLNPCRDYTQQI
jgi:hypothetical protein